MRENRNYFAALIIVALAAPAAALLLVVALVVWLGEVMGSIIYPCLMVGVFLALLAMVVYRVALRDAMREIDERLGVIYDVTKVVREVFDWLVRPLLRSFDR